MNQIIEREKMEEKKALFLGNGLNRLLSKDEGSISWQELMKDLSGCDVEKYSNYPLLFEKILHDDSDRSFEKNLRNKKHAIAEKLSKGSKPNQTLKEFVCNPSYSDILTTNYDYNIEYELDSNFDKNRCCKSKLETWNSLRRAYVVNGKTVWHIHGEYASTRKNSESESLLIGFSHYATYLQLIMNKIHDFVKPEKSMTFNEKFIKKLKDQNNGIFNEYWIFKFFTQDIDIVGFSFDLAETHLWWLLSKRAELIKEGWEQNTIRFFYIDDGKEENKQRNELLKSLGVKVEEFSLISEDIYKKTYETILKKL